MAKKKNIVVSAEDKAKTVLQQSAITYNLSDINAMVYADNKITDKDFSTSVPSWVYLFSLASLGLTGFLAWKMSK